MTEHPHTTWEEVDTESIRKVANRGRIKIVHSDYGAAITIYYGMETTDPSHIRIFVTPDEAQFIADTLGA